MADDIQEANPKEGQAVESVTEVVPHEADSSSAPTSTQDLPLNRPPVSTNQVDVPIAHSLIAGAGAGNQGQDDLPSPEEQTPAPAEPEAEAKRGPGRPKKTEESE